MDQLDVNRDMIPIALDKIYNFIRLGTLYQNIVRDAVVSLKLVQSFIIMD